MLFFVCTQRFLFAVNMEFCNYGISFLLFNYIGNDIPQGETLTVLQLTIQSDMNISNKRTMLLFFLALIYKQGMVRVSALDIIEVMQQLEATADSENDKLFCKHFITKVRQSTCLRNVLWELILMTQDNL